MKRYAKNPAELVIQNPTNNKKMANRKRDSKGRYKSKRNNPMDTADEFVDTGKNLFMQYGLAALASTGTVKGAGYLINKAPNIPAWAKEWLMIGGPAAAGIILSMYANKNSAILQGVAGGMVLASANGLSDKLINGNSQSEQMADAGILQEGDLIAKPDGYLYDQQGNRVARIAGDNADISQPEPEMSLPEMSSFEGNHLLGDWGGTYDQSWEAGEAFEA